MKIKAYLMLTALNSTVKQLRNRQTKIKGKNYSFWLKNYFGKNEY